MMSSMSSRLFSNKLKRPINVTSESDISDIDSGSDESFWEIKEKISSNAPKKRMKQTDIISSDLNKSFQNSLLSKMAADSEDNSARNDFRKSVYKNKVSEKKSYTKNALIARENRLKKKLYIENLEKNVERYKQITEKLCSQIDNQTKYINSMKKEVQYFKSLVANGNDISKILRCINQSTGLPITTSFNGNSSTTSNKSHPWCEDNNSINGELHSLNSYSETDFELDTLFSDIKPLTFDDASEDKLITQEEFKDIQEDSSVENLLPNGDHNYTVTQKSFHDTYEDVGICLHISNHRVSLEFCPTCSGKAAFAWKKD